MPHRRLRLSDPQIHRHYKRMEIAAIAGVSRDALRGLERDSIFLADSYVGIDALVAKVIIAMGASRLPGDSAIARRDVATAQLIRANGMTGRIKPEDWLCITSVADLEITNSPAAALAKAAESLLPIIAIPIGAWFEAIFTQPPNPDEIAP